MLLNIKGPALLSLREVARVAGVSHSALAHHFGDKAGLLTAVAVAGHKLLTLQLNTSQSSQQDTGQRLAATGEAYIRFAVMHPAHFSIMFQSDLINLQHPDYVAACGTSRAVLEQCVLDLADGAHAGDHEINATVVALWSQVHGFADLWLAGNFGDPTDMSLLQNLLDDLLGCE